MGEQRVSAGGKRLSVVEKARGWAEALQQAEFRGLGDTREAARYRVSRKTGVPESYLKRLRYRWEEMTDIAASQYVALQEAYADLCGAIEAKADEYERQRLQIRNQTDAVDASPVADAAGEGGACRREMAE